MLPVLLHLLDVLFQVLLEPCFSLTHSWRFIRFGCVLLPFSSAVRYVRIGSSVVEVRYSGHAASKCAMRASASFGFA